MKLGPITPKEFVAMWLAFVGGASVLCIVLGAMYAVYQMVVVHGNPWFTLIMLAASTVTIIAMVTSAKLLGIKDSYTHEIVTPIMSVFRKVDVVAPPADTTQTVAQTDPDSASERHDPNVPSPLRGKQPDGVRTPLQSANRPHHRQQWDRPLVERSMGWTQAGFQIPQQSRAHIRPGQTPPPPRHEGMTDRDDIQGDEKDFDEGT